MAVLISIWCHDIRPIALFTPESSTVLRTTIYPKGPDMLFSTFNIDSESNRAACWKCKDARHFMD